MSSEDHSTRDVCDSKGSTIVFVAAYRFPGGDAMSNRLLGLAKSVRSHRGRVVLVNDWPPNVRPRPQVHDVDGIAVITTHANSGTRVGRALSRATRPFRVLNALREAGISRADVDSVYLPCGLVTLVALLVFRVALSRRLIVDVTENHDARQFRRRGLDPYYMRHRWSRWLTRSFVGHVSVVSRTLAAVYRCENSRVVVVPPQVDILEFAQPNPPSIEERLELLYAGSPGNKDLLDVVVKGLSLLDGDQQRRVRLTIAGIERDDFTAGSDLEVDAVAALVSEIRFVGRIERSSVLDLLARSHFTILVRPTGGYADAGFPSKVPESLAAGCPVMLNYSSDLRLYVRHGEQGIVLDGFRPEAVQRGVAEALQLSDDGWSRMSLAARSAAVQTFDYRVWTSRMCELLH